MRLRRIWLLSFLLPLLIVASSATAQMTAVKVGHNGFSDEAVFYLGREVGIFKKHGIDLELIYIPGGSLSMQALIGKSLDLLLAGGTPLVYAQLKGAELRMIGGVNNLLPYVLVARESITRAEQLKGKKVGISRFGSNTDFVVKLATTQLGLNPKSDVQIVQTGGQDARVVALKSGAVDATVLTPDVAFIGRKLGFNALLDFVEKGIEYQHVGVGSRVDYLKTQGDTARRFMRAYLESIRYYFSHKEEAVRTSMRLLKVDDRQVGEIGFELRQKTLPVDGKPTVKGMQLVLDAAVEDDPKARSLTPQQLIDLSFLP
jgi:NitT/TauT family transport system substrate-binding protein